MKHYITSKNGKFSRVQRMKNIFESRKNIIKKTDEVEQIIDYDKLDKSPLMHKKYRKLVYGITEIIRRICNGDDKVIKELPSDFLDFILKFTRNSDKMNESLRMFDDEMKKRDDDFILNGIKDAYTFDQDAYYNDDDAEVKDIIDYQTDVDNNDEFDDIDIEDSNDNSVLGRDRYDLNNDDVRDALNKELMDDELLLKGVKEAEPIDDEFDDVDTTASNRDDDYAHDSFFQTDSYSYKPDARMVEIMTDKLIDGFRNDIDNPWNQISIRPSKAIVDAIRKRIDKIYNRNILLKQRFNRQSDVSDIEHEHIGVLDKLDNIVNNFKNDDNYAMDKKLVSKKVTTIKDMLDF